MQSPEKSLSNIQQVAYLIFFPKFIIFKPKKVSKQIQSVVNRVGDKDEISLMMPPYGLNITVSILQFYSKILFLISIQGFLILLTCAMNRVRIMNFASLMC